VSYNASAVKIYNAASSLLAHFGAKILSSTLKNAGVVVANPEASFLKLA
jgi:hypothetical protein